MRRREFFKYSIAMLALFNSSRVFAQTKAQKPIVVNLILDGGADFRHIFTPEFSELESSYGYNFWRARATSHNLNPNDIASLRERSLEYSKVSKNGLSFGVHPNATWLKEEFERGNVAIINNVLNSSNRDHSHSLIMLESGDIRASSHDFDRSGWGGRLAKEAGGNILSLTDTVRLFCNAPDKESLLSHNNDIVISARDSRNIGLYHYDTKADLESGSKSYIWNQRAILSRALSGYYRAKADSISTESRYYKFIQHYQSLKEFGDEIDKILDNYPEPLELTELYDSNNSLEDSYFGVQLRNLYDSLLCNSILNMQVASLESKGWDSHKRQIDSIDMKIDDIFGLDRGLDRLTKAVQRDIPEYRDRLIFVISSEFGRQLASNGDNGTDHGRGSSILVIGNRVNGGVYGNMFPDSEIDRFSIPNEDIAPKTSIQRVLAKVCDEFGAGVSERVFDLSDTIVEEGIDLNTLFS